MAAFPGSAVKFPRCRLKLAQGEAKKMKERMSNRKYSDMKEEDGFDILRPDEYREKQRESGDKRNKLNGEYDLFMLVYFLDID